MSVWSMNSVWVSSGQSVFSLVPPVSSIIVYQHGCHGSFIIGQIGFKWNKIWDLFSTFQYILARRAKMYWEWSLKSPRFVLGLLVIWSDIIWVHRGIPTCLLVYQLCLLSLSWFTLIVTRGLLWYFVMPRSGKGTLDSFLT